MAVKRRTNQKKKRVSKKKGSSFKTVLGKIKKLRPDQRTQAMKLANNKFINDSIREVKKLKHARVTPNMTKRLQHQSRKLNKFISRKTSMISRRRMLTQRGFLPLRKRFPTSSASGITSTWKYYWWCYWSYVNYL